MEFEPGQVTLDIFDPTSAGQALRRARQAWPCVCRTSRLRAPSWSPRAEFDGETVDTGVCHMAFFAVPDGNALMLHRRYAPRAGP